MLKLKWLICLIISMVLTGTGCTQEKTDISATEPGIPSSTLSEEQKKEVVQSTGVYEMMSDDGKTAYFSTKAGCEEIPGLLVGDISLDGFSPMDIVEVGYYGETVILEDKSVMQYHLSSIEHSDDMFNDAHALSEYIDFEPETIELHYWQDKTKQTESFSLDNMEEVILMIEDPKEILAIMEALDEIHAYTDGAVIHELGVSPFTVVIKNGNESLQLAENDHAISITNGEEQVELYYRNEGDMLKNAVQSLFSVD